MIGKDLKKEILEVLKNNISYFYTRGSYGELGDPVDAIVAEDFEIVTDEIIELLSNISKNE